MITPFAPFRETTLLLRYDTEDVVRPLTGPFDCSLRHLPATSNLLAKLRLAVRHDCEGNDWTAGWVFPRQILEALEAVDAVPLPARCGFGAVAGGVEVEVVGAGSHAGRAARASKKACRRRVCRWPSCT